MPRNFITRDGFGITPKARDYLAPLIAGEDYPRYKNGLPEYVTLEESAGAEKAAAVLNSEKENPAGSELTCCREAFRCAFGRHFADHRQSI